MSTRTAPWVKSKRKLLRTAKNPMDKATIVSIYPKEIKEYKHTIQPGFFQIPAGSFEHPSILVVGASSWWRNMEEGMPMLEIPVSAVSVAESVIRDKVNAMLAASMATAMPGLFFLPGEKTIIQVMKDHKDLLELARNKQDRWFKLLMDMADALWATSQGNPLTISGEMRLAASQLNFKDRPWLKDHHTVTLVPCKFCGTLKNDTFPICANCKQVTDVVRAKELGLLDEKRAS